MVTSYNMKKYAAANLILNSRNQWRTKGRGAVFSTPGTGFQVSANAGLAPIEFGNINATYPGEFSPFSPQRLFTPLGSNVTDVSFFVPGTTTPAVTSAFGAIFSDVDLIGTSLQFFDLSNNSLGIFVVPVLVGHETFEFLGVIFDSAVINRVRITSGNSVLGAGINDGGAVDLVVMDDFIYGEPTAATPAPVPEPTSLLLLGTGGLGLLAKMRRRKNRNDEAALRPAADTAGDAPANDVAGR
jgi:hypothetical protein